MKTINRIFDVVRKMIFGLHLTWIAYSIYLIYVHVEFMDRWPVWLYMTGLFFASYILVSMIFEKTLPISERTEKKLKSFIVMFRYMLYGSLLLFLNVVIRSIFS